MENNFHGNLKKARLASKMTQKEVAEKIGVAKSTYSLYESGNREPGVAVIKKIATVLNVSGDELIGLNEKDDFQTQRSITEPEQTLLYKYSSIDDKGKHTVDTVLEMEYIRCNPDQKSLKISDLHTEDKSHLMPVAAHERTDIEVTEEMKKYDDAFFDE